MEHLCASDGELTRCATTCRTGPFQPKPVIFHSHYSEPAICSFGIDLRKFDETNLNGTTSKVPPILSFLLEYMEDNYPKMSDSEKRKSWLYETPLAAQHHLRSALNGITEGFSRATVAPYDLPVGEALPFAFR